MYLYGSTYWLRSIEYPKMFAFWIVSVGTKLSDKDEVPHMEQQPIQEILLSTLASVRYLMNVHLGNLIMEYSLPIRFLTLNAN
jgi:hypothetical protein